MGKRAPKHFDLDRSLGHEWNTLEIDRLSRNDAERVTRFETAFHEAAHVVTSAVYGRIDSSIGGLDACVPRPGRSAGRSGLAGSACVFQGAPETGEPAINSLAGVFAEKLMASKNTNAARSDRLDFARLQLSCQDEALARRVTKLFLFSHVHVVDLVACALLFHSKSDGRTQRAAFAEMFKFVKGDLDNMSQAQSQRLYSRNLFVARNPVVRNHFSDGIGNGHVETAIHHLRQLKPNTKAMPRIADPFAEPCRAPATIWPRR